MRVDWRSSYEGIGNTFGYSIHDRKTREAMQAKGWEIDPAADLAITIGPAHSFEAAPGKRNLLYCAWESPTLPELYRTTCAAADVICVTAPFLQQPFQDLTGKPVHVVPEGVDPVFATVDRTKGKHRPWAGGRRFRFLWCGAPSDRKGAEWVLEAFRLFLEGPCRKEFAGKVELYIKTSLPTDAKSYTGLVNVQDEIILDDRRISEPDLVRLYQSAHCFVFPTLGEGFGLTAAEAAATGCPVIYPPHTAMPQLFDDRCGFPLQTVTETHHWGWDDCDGRGTPMHLDAVMEIPTMRSLCEQMLRVYRDPPAAFARGMIAAQRMKQFTWARTADLLTAALVSK